MSDKVDGGGLRFNKGKPKLHLVPSGIKKAIAHVLEYGMTREKDPYPKDNWKRGMPWTTVTDSLMRHVEDFNNGNDIDKDSGLPNIWLAACNIAFLIEYREIYPEGDDRVVKKVE